MTATINRRLNIVIPVDGDAGRIWVHSTPIGREVFENHWEVLAGAHARVFAQNLSITTGPSVAAMALRAAAKRMEVWDGEDGVERTLMPEIIRLSNVIMPRPDGRGWGVQPLESAARDGILTKDDAREVEDQLVFFTLVSAVSRRDVGKGILQAASGLWGWQLTLQNSTEFAASLKISTKGENSGGTAAA